MAAPATWVVGQIVTAVILNEELRNQLTGLRIAGAYASSTQINGVDATEQVTAAVTFTAEATRTYLIIGKQEIETDTASTVAAFRCRYRTGAWAVGSTDMTGSAILQSSLLEFGTSTSTVREAGILISAVGFTGSVTIAATLVRTAGSGTMVVAGGSNSISLLVIPIGAST